MREQAVLFGRQTSLVGVVTAAERRGERASGTAAILLNAGLLHHVGPNRLYVRIARALAAEGIAALRFDFSNIGDSPPRRDGMPFVRSAIDEAREAMDFLRTSTGCDRFLVIGSCAGADHALRVADEDPRVVGAGLLELQSRGSLAYELWLYAALMRRPGHWRSVLARPGLLLRVPRRMLRVGGRARPPARRPTEPAGPGGRTPPASLASILGRGASVCMIYSRNGSAYFNYRKGLERALHEPGYPGRVHVTVLSSDHMFTPVVAQDTVVRTVRDWAIGTVPTSGGFRP
jgi:pimeloyl-ACP methyl ester carboxylesterase